MERDSLGLLLCIGQNRPFTALPAGSLRPYDCRWAGTARTRIGSRRAVQEWNNDAIVLGTGLSKHGYDNNIYEKPAFDKYREVARMLAKDKYGECGTH